MRLMGGDFHGLSVGMMAGVVPGKLVGAGERFTNAGMWPDWSPQARQ